MCTLNLCLSWLMITTTLRAGWMVGVNHKFKRQCWNTVFWSIHTYETSYMAEGSSTMAEGRFSDLPPLLANILTSEKQPHKTSSWSLCCSVHLLICFLAHFLSQHLPTSAPGCLWKGRWGQNRLMMVDTKTNNIQIGQPEDISLERFKK